ncbi:hypothetical protein PIB30_064610 [Stylosanthes scabra]|uniref:Uncharacterized protein n=1 Tax=Stylosanthes scabra TaxID=79078 RepID=A0ABU6RLU7_9FABA|nr:hypothetical protein [Stylosanthes scabra]
MAQSASRMISSGEKMLARRQGMAQPLDEHCPTRLRSWLGDMGGDSAAESHTDSKVFKPVSINIRCSNDSNLLVQISLDSTVGSLRKLLLGAAISQQNSSA